MSQAGASVLEMTQTIVISKFSLVAAWNSDWKIHGGTVTNRFAALETFITISSRDLGSHLTGAKLRSDSEALRIRACMVMGLTFKSMGLICPFFLRGKISEVTSLGMVGYQSHEQGPPMTSWTRLLSGHPTRWPARRWTTRLTDRLPEGRVSRVGS